MTEKKSNNRIGGLLLIGIGVILLVGRFINLDAIPNSGLLILPAIGAIFMLSGILTRKEGLMVPGGILSGIGWGAYFVAGPFTWQTEVQQGGVFLVVFALGWLSITVMSALFAKKTVWGTLVPAAILATIGGALYFGGIFMDVLTIAGKLWPLALIVAGAGVILKATRMRDDVEKLKV